MIKGQTIQLSVTTAGAVDDFNRPTVSETFVNVDNVLISPVNGDEILDVLNLTGKKAVYQLAIPKGDTNDWENKNVKFWGQTYRTIGKPIEGQEELIPLSWNKKVKVEIVNE